MNNCTITIDARHFAAAIHCAGKRDVRYYLNGVFVEATEKETRCTATDGYTAAFLRRRSENGMGGANFESLIVPRDTAEQVNKATRGKGHVNLCRIDGRWEAVTVAGKFPFDPIVGRFPDCRAILPHKASGEPGQFNPELMSQFSKVAKALGTKAAPEVEHNGTSGAQVTLDGCDEFVGVVMPFQVPKRKGCDVSWAPGPLDGYQVPAKATA